MGLDSKKFLRITDSLRQYRRAELKDFEDDLGKRPLDKLYCDPLPGNGILNSVISSNTTFILGRKGTGKSTVFAQAHSKLQSKPDLMPIYIDVKTLSEVSSSKGTTSSFAGEEIDNSVISSHLLGKNFLSRVISEIISSIHSKTDEMSIWDKWKGKKRSFEDLIQSIENLKTTLDNQKIEEIEIPILKKISRSARTRARTEEGTQDNQRAGTNIDPIKPAVFGELNFGEFEKSLEDTEFYKEYSDIVYRVFPFSDLLNDIKDLLAGAGLRKIIIFFDDFSELNFIDQKLFVDIILSPLNNSSNESVKLKIAGYPGRVYYGKIDSTKVDTLFLDFASLYEASDVQTMELSAQDYTRRLIESRFKAFKAELSDYFDTSHVSLEGYYKLLFEASFNVPRLMGAILHICYLDNVSRGKPVTVASIRLAARKHYENTIIQYFDRMNRFALEPYENKIDRQNQKVLIESIIEKARSVRKGIQYGEIGGKYFEDLSSPPVSHFTISSSFNDVFNSLEANFFLSRYKNTRDKNGKSVTVFALLLGLTEYERLSWGYPEGRKYRNYFVQRCFDYNILIHQFLTKNQTIRCGNCGSSFSMERKDHIEFYKWSCPECQEGKCSIVNLSNDFDDLVNIANSEVQLELVELQILETLFFEDKELAAQEISSIIDTTYQLVGRRTSKLRDKGLVIKELCLKDNKNKSSITQQAIDIYFD